MVVPGTNLLQAIKCDFLLALYGGLGIMVLDEEGGKL
jgi:hypothetical protein